MDSFMQKFKQNGSDRVRLLGGNVILPSLKIINPFSWQVLHLPVLQEELKMGGGGKVVAFAIIMQHNLTLYKTTIQHCRNPAIPLLQIPSNYQEKFWWQKKGQTSVTPPLDFSFLSKPKWCKEELKSGHFSKVCYLQFCAVDKDGENYDYWQDDEQIMTLHQLISTWFLKWIN